MDKILASYVKAGAKQNLLVDKKQPVSPFFHGVRLKINEETGQGWSEMLCIQDGLYVGLADYRLNHPVENCYRKMDALSYVNFDMLLSGYFQFQIPGEKKQRVTAGDLWLMKRPFEDISYNIPDEKLCGLTLILPHDLIEAWLGTSCCEASKGLENLLSRKSGPNLGQQAIPLARSMGQPSESIRLAKDLIYIRRETFPDKLRFESLALDLLSRMLTLESSLADSCLERTRKMSSSVDEAVDILREEWNNPPTISALARRIKVNECYLKKWFREQMGMSIGEYIRELRMTKALEVIETGRCSVLEAAVYVGYSNPSQFSSAFKRYYGRLPSYYLPRSRKLSDLPSLV